MTAPRCRSASPQDCAALDAASGLFGVNAIAVSRDAAKLSDIYALADRVAYHALTR